MLWKSWKFLIEIKDDSNSTLLEGWKGVKKLFHIISISLSFDSYLFLLAPIFNKIYLPIEQSIKSKKQKKYLDQNTKIFFTLPK